MKKYTKNKKFSMRKYKKKLNNNKLYTKLSEIN